MTSTFSDAGGSTSQGNILYVAPSASLGFYFLRWLLLRCAAKEKLLHLRSKKVKAFLKRLYVLYPPYDTGKRLVKQHFFDCFIEFQHLSYRRRRMLD